MRKGCIPAFAGRNGSHTEIMKHLLAAIGLVAVGATALHGQPTEPNPTPNTELSPQEKTKFWAVSGALRGFYDDNYTAIPQSQGPLRSFGVEVSPSVSLNWAPAETLVGASYVYDWKWYAKTGDNDQTHQFNGKFVHNFTPRYRLEVNDSFVISSEPTVLDTTIITSPVKRTLEDNLRNRGSIVFASELTPILGTEVGYQNTIYDYRQTLSDMSAVPANPPTDLTPVIGPSRSALLNRIEQLVTLDLRWKILPETTGILGYQFQIRQFTSDESISPIDVGDPLNPAFPVVPASERDSLSHFLFVGVDQSVGPSLRASVRIGGQLLDYYNIHLQQGSPYADANVTWTYLPGSYAQLGLKHEHAATDLVGDPTDFVRDQEATTVYGAVTHKITAKLVGSVLGQYQNSQFNGGGAAINGQGENFFLANINLAYKINPYLLTEAGYEFNHLDSPFDRAYRRSRVYLGVRATY